MKRRPRLLAWTLLLVALFALPAGCVNPFKPATPEQPTGPPLDEDFSSVDGLLATVELAIETRTQQGADTYLRAFADSTSPATPAFRAIYDPSVKQAWESIGRTAPEPWGILLERNVHSKLSVARPTADYTFTFSPDPDSPNDEQLPGGDVLAHREYTLTATENGVAEVIASGFADLTLRNTGLRWVVLRWVDRVNPKYGAVPPLHQYTFTRYRLDSTLGVS